MWWNRKKRDPAATAARSGQPSPAGGGAAGARAGAGAEVGAGATQAPPHRTAFILLGLGGATVAAMGLAAIGTIFSLSFFALVLTICVYPIRSWLERHGIPRGVASVAVILAVVLLLGAFAGALVVSFGQFAALLPQYTDQLQAWVNGFGDWLASIGFGQAQVQSIVAGLDPGAVAGVLGGVLGSAASVLSGVVILVTMLILMAMDASYVKTITRDLRRRKPLLAEAAVGYTFGVRRYMVVTTVLGAAQGIVNWVALVILGVPGAALWGLLAFICSFIPNIGYFIAIVPPIVFAALVGGWPLVIAVIVVYGLVNGIIQSIIQPRVVGNAVALSQSLTFFSVLFWAVVLGPIGAILAIPLTLLVRMLLVDSNPANAWVRPALGDLNEARRVMDAEDAAAKAERRAGRRHPGDTASSGDANGRSATR
jgi:AI-2 transport protein TqsA